MKQHIQSFFESMAKPENVTMSILFMVVYALFWIIIGVIIAWFVGLFINKKIERHAFDDFCTGNGFTVPKIRKIK